MDIKYRKRIPYPFSRVLAQYFDLEHIETVHPTTLGEYRVREVTGNRIVFEQRWPAWLGVRVRTVIEQVWNPPDGVRIRFLKGFLRGVEISTRLHDWNEDTLIEEVYHVPLVPEWSWLRVLARPLVLRAINHVWTEDLAVELCHGGWPGVPGQSEQPASSSVSDQVVEVAGQTRWLRIAEQEEVMEDCSFTVEHRGREIVLWKQNGQVHALDNRCSHTGGPLALGHLKGPRVVCPWHGTCFQLEDGVPCEGPADGPVGVYKVRLSGHGILIEVPTHV